MYVYYYLVIFYLIVNNKIKKIINFIEKVFYKEFNY